MCVCVYLYFKPNPSPPLYVCVCECVFLCVRVSGVVGAVRPRFRDGRRCSSDYSPVTPLALSPTRCFSPARVCVSLLLLRLTALTDSRRFPQPVHTHTWTHTTNVSVMTAFTHFLCKNFLITIRPPGGTKTRTVLLH